MRYDQSRVDAFAMRTEEMTAKELCSENWLDVNGVGDTLRLDPEESRQIALWLGEEGWAALNFIDPDHPRLRLTFAGRREISKLFQPAWKRWLNRHRWWVGYAVGLAMAIVTSVITAAIHKLIWG